MRRGAGAVFYVPGTDGESQRIQCKEEHVQNVQETSTVNNLFTRMNVLSLREEDKFDLESTLHKSHFFCSKFTECC